MHKSTKAQIFLKKSGSKYGGLRKDLVKNYAKGADHYSDTVNDHQQIMEYCKPPQYIPNKEASTELTPKNGNFLKKGISPGGNNKDNANGSSGVCSVGSNNVNTATNSEQHLGAGEEKDCFKCEQKGKFTIRNCKETNKDDGTPVNSDEVNRERCQ